MAGRKGIITSDGDALAAATAKTLIQYVPPANQDGMILSFSVEFRGDANSEVPHLVELYRQSTAGTSSANTPQPLDDGWSGTLQSTARDTITVEPTTGVRVGAWYVHPQAGIIKEYARGDLMVVGGARLGLRVTTDSGVTAVATTSITFEE